MAAILLIIMGQFALSTYLRPFLEQVTGAGVPLLSTLLLVVGASDLVGLFLVGPVLRVSLPVTLVAMPLPGASAARGTWAPVLD